MEQAPQQIINWIRKYSSTGVPNDFLVNNIINSKYLPSTDEITLDFTGGVLTYSFYAPFAMKITSVTNVLNSPTTTITTTVVLTPYILGNSITLGTLVNVTVSTSSVIRLNILKV